MWSNKTVILCQLFLNHFLCPIWQLPFVCFCALRYCHVAARKNDQILPEKLKFMRCKLQTNKWETNALECIEFVEYCSTLCSQVMNSTYFFDTIQEIIEALWDLYQIIETNFKWIHRDYRKKRCVWCYQERWNLV